MSDTALKPDARCDLSGAINFIVDRVLYLEQKLAQIENKDATKASDTLTVKDIMADQAVSRSLIDKSPWKLPNWGRSDFGMSPKRWRRETYIAWMETPEDERRAKWDAMGIQERRKARGL